MWKTLKELLPSKSGYNNCTAFSPDEFNDYFSTIGNALETHFATDFSMPFLDVTCLESFHFGIIPTSFIITELLQLKDNSSPDILDLDGVALSNTAHIIAPSLQIIFNKSLELGHVPDDWKLARVTPLYKGTGSKDDRSNYRPISVISHIPKIIEKFVSFMLNKYLCENSLLKKMISLHM